MSAPKKPSHNLKSKHGSKSAHTRVIKLPRRDKVIYDLGKLTACLKGACRGAARTYHCYETNILWEGLDPLGRILAELERIEVQLGPFRRNYRIFQRGAV